MANTALACPFVLSRESLKPICIRLKEKKGSQILDCRQRPKFESSKR